MEYLYKVLGIKATVQRAEFDHLPNYIAVRYRLQKVSMDGQKVIFLYPKTELEQIEVLKKHIARIQKKENLPVVLVLNELSSGKANGLCSEGVYWGGYAGKRIFGTGRIFDAERTSRRVLCDR